MILCQLNPLLFLLLLFFSTFFLYFSLATLSVESHQ